MKTTMDILDLMYDQTVNASLGTTLEPIDGGVYKLQRPDDSLLEDIIVNALPVSSGLIQWGTANVNIHVPDLKVSIAGRSQYVPDTQRLKELGTAYANFFEHLVLDGYELWIENQAIFGEPEIHQHYLNLRVKIRIFN